MEATIRPGTLLYFDSLTAGLIPCQVRKVWRDNDHLCIDAVCTATRKWCKRGETLCDATDGAALHFVPREAIYVRSHQYRIRPYQWVM